VIGTIGFHGPPDERGRLEVSCRIDPAQRSRGYAAEALSALLDWTTARYGVNRFLVALPTRRAYRSPVRIAITVPRVDSVESGSATSASCSRRVPPADDRSPRKRLDCAEANTPLRCDASPARHGEPLRELTPVGPGTARITAPRGTLEQSAKSGLAQMQPLGGNARPDDGTLSRSPLGTPTMTRCRGRRRLLHHRRFDGCLELGRADRDGI
jgi:hypothetical protein